MRAVRVAFEKYMFYGSERLVRVGCRVIEETESSQETSWKDSLSVVYDENDENDENERNCKALVR